MDTPAIQVAPRVGFSWDVTGDGKTAVRGGFGVFPDRFNDDIVLQHVELPPLVNTPTANYTTIGELLATPLSLSPAQVRTLDPDYKPQYTYNYSIGVQRDLGWQAGRRLRLRRLEGRASCCRRATSTRVPYGTNFLPRASTRRPAAPLPNERSCGRIAATATSCSSEFAGFSNYDALQIAVNRRYTAGLRFGVVLHRSLKTQERGRASPPNDQSDGEPVPRRSRDRNYGDVGRRHNLAVNYSYEVPNAEQQVEHVIAEGRLRRLAESRASRRR